MQNQTKRSLIIAIDIDDFLTSMETKALHRKGWLDPVHHSEKHFIMAEFNYCDHDYQVENVLTHPYPYLINHHGDDTPCDPDDYMDQFKSSNTIFYATGVLNRALERHVSEGLPITEILWQEQGALWIDLNRYKERYPIHFFTKGRDILRKYNPELNFAVASSEPGKRKTSH